jgi:hypothetical protein
MHCYVLAWKKPGLQRRPGRRIATCADDRVILWKRGSAEEALSRLREIMLKLKLTLTLNGEKTSVCKEPEGVFDFVGYTFGQPYPATTGQARMGMRPSKEGYPAHGRNDSCDDRSQDGVARNHGTGRQVEPHVARLGETLQGRPGQTCLTGARQLTRPLRGCVGRYATGTSLGVAGAAVIHPGTSTGISVSCA